MNLIEKQLNYEYKYKGKIINLRKDEALLPDGNTAAREVIEHPGGVCVAALTDDEKVLIVKQFRYPYFEVTAEIPAGKRDNPDEDPLTCGKRELEEETGAKAEHYTFLGKLYPSPGYCGEIIWMYAATGLTFGKTHPDDDEFLNLEQIDLDELVEMIIKGEIPDAKTQTAVLKLKFLHEKGEI